MNRPSRAMSLAFAATFAAACTQGPDPYDPAKMDLKPVAAKLSNERQKGPFASGSSISLGAELKTFDPSPVKEVRLDTTHKVIEIAPGVKFSAWTFGDQVPGPTVRARVGDRVKFSMTNRSDEPVPGVQLTAAPMMHSMDFHAAMVSPQDKYRSIAPGQTIEFEFTLNYPGIFMYHCGTPMILEHIASGMYGAVIVEPRAGYPTKVDREYVIVQSEFYAKPDERVRLHVLNVGPSKTSSFHVVGTIFDRVWIEGNPDNQFRGMQTVLLGSSNSATVEFMIPEAGSYIMVDHHFANASQGAIGLISTNVKPETKDLEHHNLPASAAPSDPETVQGKLAFESKCLACHSVGEGKKLGPDVAGVTKRRTDAWLARWLREPEKMLATDADAKALLKEHDNIPMPNQS